MPARLFGHERLFSSVQRKRSCQDYLPQLRYSETVVTDIVAMNGSDRLSQLVASGISHLIFQVAPVNALRLGKRGDVEALPRLCLGTTLELLARKVLRVGHPLGHPQLLPVLKGVNQLPLHSHCDKWRQSLNLSTDYIGCHGH